MNYRSYNDLSNIIKKKLHLLQKYDFDLIVGIPRSGMIPAYMIALFMNIKCCDVNSFINNTPLENGITRESKSKVIIYPHNAKRVLLVDDSINSGTSLSMKLSEIKDKQKTKITTLAIYSSQRKRDDVDLFLEYLPLPRVFEWNIFHHKVVENSCFDIDGVLCLDPTIEQNDDGERYLNFLINAQPLFIPTGKIKYIVTSRLEKYRANTENWLEKHEVDYETLEMLDVPSKEERLKLGCHAEFKANIYNKSDTYLFYESNREQAIKINELTKKPVYCVDTNEFITGKKLLGNNTVYGIIKKSFIPKLVKKISKPMYFKLRTFYRKIAN